MLFRHDPVRLTQVGGLMGAGKINDMARSELLSALLGRALASELDLDLHAGGQLQAHQGPPQKGSAFPGTPPTGHPRGK